MLSAMSCSLDRTSSRRWLKDGRRRTKRTISAKARLGLVLNAYDVIYVLCDMKGIQGSVQFNVKPTEFAKASSIRLRFVWAGIFMSKVVEAVDPSRFRVAYRGAKALWWRVKVLQSMTWKQSRWVFLYSVTHMHVKIHMWVRHYAPVDTCRPISRREMHWTWVVAAGLTSWIHMP